jgi:ABC-type Zn uptake system ZnuABC Zn-binding protein ZnuA
MNRLLANRFLVAALLLVCVPSALRSADAPRVAATIFPLYDIVREIGGITVEPVLVLPSGASPHTFEPRPATVRQLAGAIVLFRVGHGLDDWVTGLAQASGVRNIVVVDAGVTLRLFPGDGKDPHYWLACENGKAIARTVAAELERLLPRHASFLRGRLAAYLERLDEADADIRGLLNGLPSRSIATLHDGFGYFAAAYDLKVAATFERSGDRDPSPRAVAEFQQRVRAAHVRAIFAEPQISKDAIRPIAGDLGLPIVTLDDLGGLPGRDSYIELLLFDARQIASALGGKR